MSDPTPTAPDVERMPTVFLSHGAPLLADDPVLTKELADWGRVLPKPTAVLVVSAHWESAPLAIGAIETVQFYYDFCGFARKYYEVQYPTPGAPRLAESVARFLTTPGKPLHQDSTTAHASCWPRCIPTLTSPCSKSPFPLSIRLNCCDSDRSWRLYAIRVC